MPMQWYQGTLYKGPRDADHLEVMHAVSQRFGDKWGQGQMWGNIFLVCFDPEIEQDFVRELQRQGYEVTLARQSPEKYFVTRRDGRVRRLARLTKDAEGIKGEFWKNGDWHESGRARNYLVDPLAGEEITKEEAERIIRSLSQRT